MFPIGFISQHFWTLPQAESLVNFLLAYVCVDYCIEIVNRSNARYKLLYPKAHWESNYAKCFKHNALQQKLSLSVRLALISLLKIYHFMVTGGMLCLVLFLSGLKSIRS